MSEDAKVSPIRTSIEDVRKKLWGSLNKEQRKRDLLKIT